MSACQPVPTIAQRKALQRDHERRYRDAAIGEYRAAQIRWEMERLSRQPEPVQFCAEVDETETSDYLWDAETRVSLIFTLAVAGLYAIAYFWGLPA